MADSAPFLAAVAAGDVATAKAFLAQHPTWDVNALHPAGSGLSALHCAVRAGHHDMVAYLLEQKAEVNLRIGFDGTTPLHEAALAGHVAVAQLLVAHGAQVGVMDGYELGDTPMNYAAIRGHLPMVQYLREAEAEQRGHYLLHPEVLWHAAGGGHLRVVKDWVANEKPGAAGHYLSTAMHIATKEEQLVVMAYLIGQGVDLTERSEGQTVLGSAISHGKLRATELLLHYPQAAIGVDEALSEAFGSQHCHEQVREKMVETLLGAYVPSQGQLAAVLRAEAAEGNRAAVEILVKRSALLPTLRDAQGRTALDVAKAAGQIHVLDYLERHQAQQHVRLQQSALSVGLAR